jgi:PAS domain S-box-containing protein
MEALASHGRLPPVGSLEMSERFRSPRASYATAVAAVAVAAVLRAVLAGRLIDIGVFLPFVMAVVVAAWHGGLRPGLLAGAIATVLIALFFLEAPLTTRDGLATHGVALLLFAAAGAAVSWLAESLHVTNRRLGAEQRGRETADAFHRAIADLTSDFAFRGRIGTDGRAVVEDITEGFHQLLGLGRRQVIEQGGWRNVIHPDDLPLADAALRRLLTGRLVEGTIRLVDAARQAVWIRYRVRLAGRNPDGTWLVYGAADNITELERAEEARQASDEVARAHAEEVEALIAAVPAVVWIAHDPDCRRITGSRYGQELLGLDAEIDASGPHPRVRHFRLFRAGREVPHEALPMLKAARGLPVRDEELEVVFADGHRLVLFGNAVPLYDPAGHPRGAIGAFVDVTALKRAEEARAESERRLLLSLDAGRMGVWDWDLLTGRVEWTGKLESILGLAPGAFGGRIEDFREMVHPDDRAALVAMRERALAEHAPLELEFRMIRPDGSICWMATKGSALFNAEGRPIRMIGVGMDVTDRRRAELALKEADRRKDEFLATLAHELRNPLAPIRNAVEILQMPRQPAEVLGAARDVIDRQVTQMVHLVDDLLDVSRISRNQLRIRRQTVELSSVLRNAIETSRPVLDASHHRLTTRAPRDPIYVEGDATRLSQVVANLLNNAAKYSPAGSEVRLTVECGPGEVRIAVRDQGIGIEPRHLERIFGMFSQVAPALQRSQGGLGIGLSLVRRLVELHGGRVAAHSDGPGHGSEFVVTLPTVSTPPVAVTAVRAAEAPVRLTRILVVDDNHDAAESLAQLLRLRGHEVHVAYNGPEAVASYEAYRPELVLLDIGLPELNGYDAARRIRELPGGRSVRLVALTGWGQEEDRQRSREAGFDEHLVKPVDLAALERLLRDASATAA